MGNHDGTTMIKCFNMVVYTHWCNCIAMPLFGKQVDVMPHACSILSFAPIAAAKA